MGYLDDLRREAELARQAEEESYREQRAREAAYDRDVRPLMIEALHFVRELSSHLAAAPNSARMDFEFPVIGRVRALALGNHRVHVDNADNPRRVRLSFEARADDSVRFPLERKDAAELVEFLHGQHAYHSTVPYQGVGRDQVLLTADLGVRTTVQIVADAERQRILVETTNFRKPGHEEYAFTPDVAATGEWRDRLAGFIFGKVDTLQPRRELSEAERDALARRLQEARERRPSHAEQPTQDPVVAPTALLERPRGLLARLAPVFSRGS